MSLARAESRPAILGNELHARYWSGWQGTAETFQAPYRPTGRLAEALKVFEAAYLQPGWEYITAGRQVIDDESSPANGRLSGLQLVYAHPDGVRTFSVQRSILGVEAQGIDDYRTMAFQPEVVKQMTDEGPGRFFVDPSKLNPTLEGTGAYIKRINAGFNVVAAAEAEMRALQDSPFKDFGFMQEGVLRIDWVIKHYKDEAYRHEGRASGYRKQVARNDDTMNRAFLAGALSDAEEARAMIVANPIPLL